MWLGVGQADRHTLTYSPAAAICASIVQLTLLMPAPETFWQELCASHEPLLCAANRGVRLRFLALMRKHGWRR